MTMFTIQQLCTAEEAPVQVEELSLNLEILFSLDFDDMNVN